MSKKKLEAVIWDMDGVLVDTKEYHYQTWNEAYQRYSDDKEPLKRSEFEAVFGMKNGETIIRLFGEQQVTPELIDMVSAEKEALFRQRIHGNIKPFPGVRAWLGFFQNHGQKQAVASSAPELNIRVILDELRLWSFFDVVLSGGFSLALASKPAPDIFLEAARRLRALPARCLVIEDSIVGVQAAKSAGMACLAITTTHPAGELITADWTIDDFGALEPQTMLEMWNRLKK